MTLRQQHPLSRIPLETWRVDAACAGHKDLTLWDSSVDKPERETARAARHARAAAICNTQCPVRAECAAAVEWQFDEGVRGGHVLPPINARQSSNASRRDIELLRLLKAGVPLDEAARIVGPGRKKAS